MDTLQIIKCKNCGAPLNLNNAENGVIQCEYCRSTFTVAKKQTLPTALEYLRIGEHDLDTCKFDDAYTAFSKAASIDGNEPEAYFNMALAKFKVQFISDAVTNCLQPVCHEISDRKFSEDKHYLKACELATPEQKMQYERHAQDIDYIRGEFFKLKQSGLEYDCFICVKVTDDETKLRTADYKDADDIYYHLRKKGFKPFFSEREIRGLSGADYEARILYALYSSECMLVVCSDENYLQTPWVKNEYTRFLKLINDGEKDSDSITTVFNGKPISKLPGRNGKLQGIDLADREAFVTLTQFVENHTPQARERREREKREQSEQLKRQFEEQQRKIDEELKKLSGAKGAAATVDSLLKRAVQEMNFGNWTKAKEYFDKVLDADPENSEAWWQLFLMEFKVTHEDELLKSLDGNLERRVNSSRNFQCAVNYASGEIKQRVSRFQDALHSPENWWAMFLNEMGVADEKDILEHLTEATKRKIDSSVNYANAVKYADENFSERLKKFNDARYSPSACWKLFLEEFNAENEDKILNNISETLRDAVENSENYLTAKQYAQGELAQRIARFDKGMYSAEVWFNLLLRAYNAKDAQQLADNFEYCNYREVKERLKSVNGQRYCEPQLKISLTNLENALDAQAKAYEQATKCWDALLKQFECKKNDGLAHMNVQITSSKNYKNSLSYARQSKDKKLINLYETVGNDNVAYCKEINSGKRADFIYKILIFAACLIPSVAASVVVPLFFWAQSALAFKISFLLCLGIGAVYQIICLLLPAENEGRQPVMGMLVQLLSFTLYAGALLSVKLYGNILTEGSSSELAMWSMAVLPPATMLVTYFEQVRVAKDSDYGFTNNVFLRFAPLFAVLAIHTLATPAAVGGEIGLWHVIAQLVLTVIAISVIFVNDFKSVIPYGEHYAAGWIAVGGFTLISGLVYVGWLCWPVVVGIAGVAVIAGIIFAIIKSRR